MLPVFGMVGLTLQHLVVVEVGEVLVDVYLRYPMVEQRDE
jgi:hypothetical protein